MKQSTKKIIVIGTFALLAGLILLIVYLKISANTEYYYEMNDMQALRGAEATAMLIWKDKKPEAPTEYWYNAAAFELIDISEPRPKPYGLGKRRVGNAMKDFQQETGLDYAYDEGADYSDKVIRVIVDTDEAGNLRVRSSWE